MDRTDLAFDLPADVVVALYERAGGAKWDLSRERFAAALSRSCVHRFGHGSAPEASALRAYLEGLHVRDLALACACRDGIDTAWDEFVGDIQPRVRAAAIAIAGPSGADLADTLLADLYGTTSRDGERRSLLAYFHGRSQLTTWLRTVLAQRHVDEVRRQRREVPLDAFGQTPEQADRPQRPEIASTPEGVADARGHAVEDPEVAAILDFDRPTVLATFQRVLAAAIEALPSDARLRLASYYVQGLTLAQIGRVMGEHESSVSRKLDRSRRELRAHVERTLREQHRFSDADLAQCYAEAPRFGAMDVGALLQGSGLGAQGSRGLKAHDG